MKYEITKGSEKDFEGAPDWARLVVEHCEFKYNTWFYESDKAGGKWKQCKGQLRGVVERDGIGNWLNIIAERRPITEPVWDGFSSVRVGEACEVRPYSDATEWQAGIVNYLSDHTIVIGLSSMTNGKAELVAHPATLKFRPIRSPEDVARDEAIEQMISILNEGTSTQDDARDIYEAIAAGKIPGVKLE